MEQTDYRAPAAQDVQPTPTPPPEPTTAEAFATVRKWCDDVDEGGEAVQMLSLLERRMTTTADALRHIQRWCNHDRGGTEMPETLQNKVNAALTDAPNRRTS